MKVDFVLDASALCAFHLFETGRDRMISYLEFGTRVMHAVNIAEVCFTLSRRRPEVFSPDSVWDSLVRDGIGRVMTVDRQFLALTAKIRLHARALSVGDGFAVALASTLDVPVLTADRAFLQAADFARIELIR